MHILIVEPDVVLAKTYAASLERSGHSVACVRTAQQAVQSADQRSPNLVILEPQLARHNGIELLYEFRSYTEWQHIPIIVLTNIATDTFLDNTVLNDILEVKIILQKSHTSLKDLVKIVESHGATT